MTPAGLRRPRRMPLGVGGNPRQQVQSHVRGPLPKGHFRSVRPEPPAPIEALQGDRQSSTRGVLAVLEPDSSDEFAEAEPGARGVAPSRRPP